MLVSRTRRGVTSVVVVLAAVIAASTAWATVTQTPLKLSKPGGSIAAAAVSATYFVWAHAGTATHGHVWIAEQTMSGGLPAGTITNVSTTGDAYPGTITGTRLVYQQLVGSQSDIKFFNLSTHAHSNPPLGINTTQFEADPSATATWLLFDRSNATSNRVLLYNFQTHSVRVLADATGSNSAFAGQVNGNYAVYTLCHTNTSAQTTACHVEVYAISSRTTQQIPLAAGSPGDKDLDPAIDSNGTVYFTREATGGCGDGDQIMQWPLGGPTVSLVTLKTKYTADSYGTYNDGNDQLTYVKASCGNAGSGVFRITNP